MHRKKKSFHFYIPPHDSGIFGFKLAVHVSVHTSICASIFSFPDDNLWKYKLISSKPGVCVDIVEIWFGIANWQILSFLTVLSAGNT